MSSELEELEINAPDYTGIINGRIKEAEGLRSSTAMLKNHLQAQFVKEFDEGSRSHNRGMLYAQCGTNCQAVLHMLNGIVSDLELLDDLPLHPKEQQDIGVVEEIQVF